MTVSRSPISRRLASPTPSSPRWADPDEPVTAPPVDDERSDDLDTPLPPSERLAARRPAAAAPATDHPAPPSSRPVDAGEPEDERDDERLTDFDDFLYDADELYDPAEPAGAAAARGAARVGARRAPARRAARRAAAAPAARRRRRGPARPTGAARSARAPDPRQGPARSRRSQRAAAGRAAARSAAAMPQSQPPQGPRGGGLGPRRRGGGLPAVSRRRLVGLAHTLRATHDVRETHRRPGRVLRRLVAAMLAIGALDAPPSPAATRARPALTLRQAVGQHMIFAYDGLEPAAGAAPPDRARRGGRRDPLRAQRALRRPGARGDAQPAGDPPARAACARR